MLDTKTILVKDLKFFNGTLSFAKSLKELPLDSMPSNVGDGYFFPNLDNYLLTRKICGDRPGQLEIGYLHVQFFRALEGLYFMSHDSYALPFIYNSANNNRLLIKNGVLNDKSEILYEFFQKVMVYGFSFPTLINDFYRNALEMKQPPEIISQLYHLLICFLPEKLFFRDDLNPGKQFEPWDGRSPSYF